MAVVPAAAEGKEGGDGGGEDGTSKEPGEGADGGMDGAETEPLDCVAIICCMAGR